ncbi:hypothetical protein GYMLUDRAFT_51831 [Collybiopsis luxurians FD-317 M1]|nr:hypothetical protein GYMLUDRAFT_51831 [Collybiopsis luxurians FD-317 M1]
MFLRRKVKPQNAGSSSPVSPPEPKPNVDPPQTPLFARFSSTSGAASNANVKPMVSGPMSLGTRKQDLEGGGSSGRTKVSLERRDDVQKPVEAPSSALSPSRASVKPGIHDKPLPPPMPAPPPKEATPSLPMNRRQSASGPVPIEPRMGRRISAHPSDSIPNLPADMGDSTEPQSLLSSRSSSTRKSSVPQDLRRNELHARSALTSVSNDELPSDPDVQPIREGFVSRPTHDPPSSYRVSALLFFWLLLLPLLVPRKLLLFYCKKGTVVGSGPTGSQFPT